jgi:hypothetical protein
VSPAHKRLLELAELVKIAEARARIALCEREDMKSVIAESEGGFHALNLQVDEKAPLRRGFSFGPAA